MNAPDFLRLLWGDRPPGFIEIWTLRAKHSHYLQVPDGAGVIAGGTADAYTGTCLAGRRMDKHRRASAAERVALAGLWLDVDVNGGPDRKAGAAPTKADAIAITGAHLAPTLVVDSGYGVHAWWLLDAPWRFASRAEQQAAAQASVQWYALHRSAANRQGWTIDHAHDLARLLRLPGTLNAKDPGRPRPVEVLAADGPRYPRAELRALAATAGPVVAPEARVIGDRVEFVARSVEAPPAKTEALAFNSPEFAAALEHAGHPHWSQSEWDMSLAAQAVAAGWSDQEVADLLTWDRERHGKGSKARRTGYMASTIARARSRADRDQAAADLKALARTVA